MRKLVLGMLVLVVAASMVGCADVPAETHSLSIVTTVFPAYDFARSVAGGLAEVRMLIKPGADVHNFEPTPQDILALERADVILWIGGENEAWMQRLLGPMDLAGKTVIRLIDTVEPIYEEDHDHDGHAADEAPPVDEHIWTSPKNAMRMVDAVREALTAADEGSAAQYRSNADALTAKISGLDRQFRSLVDGAARRELVFGDRFPFAYFAREYGLTAYAAFPNCTSDTEPSAKDVAALIERVKRDSIPVVYKIEQSSGRVADTIAKDAGASVLVMDSCHNPTQQQLDAGEDYLSLMTANLAALREGLY